MQSERKAKKFLSRRDLARLLASAKTPRDRLMVCLMACGIRATEVIQVRVVDIRKDTRGAWIEIRRTRAREVPISDRLCDDLRAFARVEGLKDGDCLLAGFRGTSGKPNRRPPLTRSGVSQALTTMSAEKRHVHPRELFDYALGQMAAAGIDPRLASRVLGVEALTGSVASAFGAIPYGPISRQEHDAVVSACAVDL